MPRAIGATTSRRFAAPTVLVALAAAGAVALAAAGDEPRVVIEGGVRRANAQFYDWNVINRHTSPIVFIEFPQYHADTFTAPDGWSQDWKNRAMVGGGEDAPGWVRTGVEDPAAGIPPGGRAEFSMRLGLRGADARRGSVTIRFADGSEVIVPNVELPSAKSFMERNVMTFGLAAIFLIALLIHLRRRRKAAPASAPPPPG